MLRGLLSLNKFNLSNYKTRRDVYKTLHIILNEKITTENLILSIQKHQQQQRQINSQAIWVFLNSDNLEHVSCLVNKFGFKIQNGIDNKISLYKWLAHEKDVIPPFSTFFISSGAVVIKDDHLLLVQEASGPRKGLFGIPGGRADPGQFIQRTAQRQLFEETGIISKFQYLIYFRQMQKTIYGANDLYFACMMKPDPETLTQQLKICNRELSSYQWIHLSKLPEFCKNHSIGTQVELSNYLNQLYLSGYNFHNQDGKFPNLSKKSIYSQAQDKVIRQFVEHRLIIK